MGYKYSSKEIAEIFNKVNKKETFTEYDIRKIEAQALRKIRKFLKKNKKKREILMEFLDNLENTTNVNILYFYHEEYIE